MKNQTTMPSSLALAEAIYGHLSETDVWLGHNSISEASQHNQDDDPEVIGITVDGKVDFLKLAIFIEQRISP